MTFINAIEQGDVRLFSHFESDGIMWAGSGNRTVDHKVEFKKYFQLEPVVQISVTLMDADSNMHVRYSLTAENITNNGFDIVFKTWLDSRFARVWVHWMAIGEGNDPDMWDNL